MTKSILTTDMDRCYICGRPKQCVHHIFMGPLRKVSDKHGFVAPLCNACHNMSDYSVHFNRKLDLYLKQECQRKFELTHTRTEWMKIIGRNYL